MGGCARDGSRKFHRFVCRASTNALRVAPAPAVRAWCALRIRAMPEARGSRARHPPRRFPMNDSIKYVLDESAPAARPGTTCAADLPVPPAARAASGHATSRSGRTTSRRSSRWSSSCRRCRPSAEIEIPEPVRDVYRQWRPDAALPRAPAGEGARYAGADLLQVRGRQSRPAATSRTRPSRRRSTTSRRASSGSRPRPAPGSGASSLAFAGALFGLEVQVFMVRVSYDQKPYRRALMETYGARCIAVAVRPRRDSGRAILAKRADHPGSLGIAISEAVEIAAQRDDTKYALGQRAEPRAAAPDGDRPGGDGADGDGRRLSGRHRRLHRRRLELRGHRVPVPAARSCAAGARCGIVAIEPAACPSLTRGRYAYDFGDTGHLTPLTKMHTLGSTFTPPGFHAGGLRYHGMAPLVSHLKELGLIDARAYHQIAGVRGGRAVRARGGHRAGARGESRGEGRDRRGDPLPRGGPLAGDPVQPVRPRPLRHAGVHRLLRRQAARTSTTTRPSLRWRWRGCPR